MDFQTARKHMVECQVRPNDVTDLDIQTALETVPRELFLPANLREIAYAEREHVYSADNTEGVDTRRVMLTARDFGKLLTGAKPRKTDHVLDVACGSGYTTAILGSLCEMVIGLENNEKLREAAQHLLSELKIDNSAIVDGDLTEGQPSQGPYDLIFIGAGITTEPTALLSQLKSGGRLVAIWREGAADKGVLYQRAGDTISRVNLFDAGSSFVLSEFAAKPGFSFK